MLGITISLFLNSLSLGINLSRIISKSEHIRWNVFFAIVNSLCIIYSFYYILK